MYTSRASPPFLWRRRRGVRVAFYRCAFLRFFIGRFVISSGNSNWTAGSAPVEVGLLGLCVGWTIDPATALGDVFQNHGIPSAKRLAASVQRHTSLNRVGLNSV